MQKIFSKENFNFFYKPTESTPKPDAVHTNSQGWRPIRTRNWDGEKTPGELGHPTINVADHVSLRYRSYDAYDTIDTVKIISGKFFKYIIGSGLKLQAEPNEAVLSLENINEDYSKFKKTAEARFSVYSNSKYCSQNKQKDLHDLANDAFSAAFLGGDCLCVVRFTNTGLTMQVIDGEHIQTPWLDNELLKKAQQRKNFISHGVEYDKKGEHVGFFVRKKTDDLSKDTFEYIKAKGAKTNRIFAWMIYGDKQRVDHHRGVPKIAAILEKVNKLDRYTEAAVGKAEEAANMLMSIEHGAGSTGETPFTKALTKKLNKGTEDEPEISSSDLADKAANTITQSSSKTVVNLPQEAKLTSFGTDIESSFSEFHTAVFSSICASVDLPPEVALQRYDSNYSASRAAIGSWEYISNIHREKHAKDFYKRFYSLWLEYEILNNKINAPGFIEALNTDDFMIIESYSACRFTGKKMPHIDPLKEVKAARLMLGDDNTPLASREQVTEYLNLGDWFENFKKYLQEDENIPEEKTPITEPVKN
ncbi:phage portal protein [Tenacibaculum finnmarkense]|uniref:phage portal protein n=1 Tax=Tenacibaculum finnmarkense TaxID=2781243 RepID=UPI00207AB731|nr:phage portal protein [Tenacibaculum finnmarkense]MCM8906820.1 phage portal protein [Tenacibaculum finnmarkense genomovar finnmarkense]